jgi:hypothetical protein
VFVKGHVGFTINGQSFEFVHQNISVFGVTGLPWGPLDPREFFGKAVTATVRIPHQPTHDLPVAIRTRAYIMREQTLYAQHMGLRFQFDAEQEASLDAHINKHGFYPTEYVRKYPRIPSSQMIQTFPLRVLVAPERKVALPVEEFPLVFDVSNLSPNGLLIHTENQIALDIMPGQRLELVLEPRGRFPMQVAVQGLVCRITDEIHPQSGNLIRYLGVKFTRVDEINKTAFLDLLKDILERIKKRAGV